MEREKFSSRLGFLLISAGCAIGLGNVWRFPYITGQYGGAAFVLLYIVFLIILGLPIVVMEFSVGRASQKSPIRSFEVLERKGQKWHLFGYVALAGNYILMMFYTTIAGLMLLYFAKTAKGDFVGMTTSQIEGVYGEVTAQPWLMLICMVLVVFIGFGICSLGLKNGVEKITKVMMLCLLFLIIVLVIRSLTLPNASEGLKFYLLPDFGRMMEAGLADTIFAAMSQAFFTLSIGIGSLAIFGSYIGKERRLTGDAISITVLDTFVAVMSGLIIFPACFSFGVEPGSGPGLIFQTLPNIFNEMQGGRIWGSLFFIFMAFAALSTVIAVFENIISSCMDKWGWSRKKAVLINIVLVIILSLPCVLGFSVLSGIQPFGAGSTIMDLEDFIVSSNLLPLGSLVYLLFCVTRYGWGWDNFIEEANTGKGIKFPKWTRKYITFVLPLIVLVIFVQGYISKFFL
ncbi:sodium-dependent transporter [Massilioclostridium coli]|uniref:sodium-dependent transporter n=1 Tax=Massilioclostridium coli TaxID=1870991 RepID=UPI00085CA73B|nr:sodium-dependent transporter [Massilioclostridium coli]PWN00515.1 MAG: sodium-dependent transporter [Massilioclostridium sp.]